MALRTASSVSGDLEAPLVTRAPRTAEVTGLLSTSRTGEAGHTVLRSL